MLIYLTIDHNKVRAFFATAVAASAAFVAFPAEISGAATPLITPPQPPGAGTRLSVHRRLLSAPVPIATSS